MTSKLMKKKDEHVQGPNHDMDLVRGRLIRGNSYKDLSTVMVMPTRGVIPAKVVQSLLSLATPMNQKFTRIFVEKMEVGEAYNAAIDMILANPELAKWKYLLTVEEDNVPPPDGLLKLYESMNKHDVVSGLYFVKGQCGAAMIYGNPQEMPRNFIPQVPVLDSIQPCNGIGMGFALFPIEMFRKIPKPWFRTMQEAAPGGGIRASTQDLYFCDRAAQAGFRFAVDTRVRVGHWDQANETMW